ncbi:MAG: cysteine synthase A [Clostridium sp.]|nr:cysteine synthase A [Clostridium sp.]MDY3827189.1 cysteine synthase A [Clostridium sp.]
MVINNILDFIGNTPILKANKVVDNNMAQLYVKLEKFNPGGSIKDRAALGMIEEAERTGKLKKGMTIIEPTSGNTGIGLAMIGRLKGYKVIIVMPESMSKERRDLISAYGAELILTEGNLGMKGAIDKAIEYEKQGGYFIPQQFENEANMDKHYETTAEEILKDIPDVDYVIAGVGTGGTISGIGKKLKEKNKNVKIIAVEPETSAVISGEKAGKHGIQGIGAGFIPKVYKPEYIDEVVKVSDKDAINMAVEYSAQEGVLVGISSGAAIYAGVELAKKIDKDKKVLVISPDGGEKYISMGIYN